MDVEAALAHALDGATKAARWDVVVQLARELEAATAHALRQHRSGSTQVQSNAAKVGQIGPLAAWYAWIRCPSGPMPEAIVYPGAPLRAVALEVHFHPLIDAMSRFGAFQRRHRGDFSRLYETSGDGDDWGHRPGGASSASRDQPC